MTQVLYGGLIPDKVPAAAIGLKLHRINSRDELLSCETVIFSGGRTAVIATLNRAGLAGRIDVGGDIENHFADIVEDQNGTWSETVALDAKSYKSLKNHWMRCKLERPAGAATRWVTYWRRYRMGECR